MSIDALLQWLTQAIFVLIWILTLMDYVHGRSPQRRDVTLMFGSLAVTVVAQWLLRILAVESPWVRTATSLIVMAQPYLLLRLVHYYRTIPRWSMGIGLGGLVVSWIVLLMAPQPIPPLPTILIVGYFAIVEGYASFALIRGALAASGEVKRRLTYAAIGTVLLAALVALAGVSTAAPSLAGLVGLISRPLGVAAAVSYYLGFAPAGWMHEVWRGMRLGRQVAALVVVATLVTALGTGAVIATEVLQTWRAQIEQSQQSLAQLAAETTSQHFTRARSNLAQTASGPSLRDVVGREPWDLTETQKMLDELSQDLPETGSAFLLDAQGVMRSSSNVSSPSLGLSLADREYYQMVVRTRASYLSNPFRTPTGAPALVVAAPVFGRDGQLRAVVATSFDLAELAQVLQIPGSASGTQVVVVAPSGEIAVHPDATRVLAPASTESARAADALAGRVGVATEQLSGSGPERLVAYRPVPTFSWGVLVSTPTAQLFGPLGTAVGRAAIVALALILLLSVASATIATRLFRPLRALAAASDRFGTGDYNVRVVTEGAPDVRALSERFNAMASAVADQATILEIQSAEAQQRAAELQALLDLTESVTTDLDVAGVADRIADYAGRILSASVWGILLPTEQGDLEIVATGGLEAEERRGRRLPVEATFAGRAFRSGVPLVIDDTQDDPIADYALPQIRSWLAVPLGHRGAVIGILNFGATTPRAFGPGHVALAQIVAGHAALALARAQLVQQLQVQNAALGAASRQKSEFLANMSHELRTPLNAINGFSRLMLIAGDDEFDAETRRGYLETVHESGQHLLQLINDILDLSKVEAGKMELRPTPVDVAALVLQVLNTVEPLAARKQITLTSDAESAGEITADEGKVKQILYNLLSNAIKFTPEDGYVAVVARRLPDAMELIVADTGIGVAPEDQERMFEAFQQLDAGANRQYEGTGLGLALTKRLVALHGGSIRVESEVGHGTQFSVLLPFRPVAPLESHREPSPTVSGTGPLVAGDSREDAARPLVLIVEDDPRAAGLLDAYLRRGGYRSAQVGNGREAIEQARALQPVAITLDIMLPELDGWEVLRALKLDPSTQDIPVIVVSVVDDQQLGYALGAVDYMVKPVDGEALLARLARYTFTTKVKQREVRVLVVDDDPSAVELLAHTLEPEGFTVLRASGGAEGIALAREYRPDVMLLDLMMPEVTGFDVVAALREDPTLHDIAILIVTARDLTEEDKQLLNGRIAAVLRKGSMAADGLLSRLEDITRRSRIPARALVLDGAMGAEGGDR